MVGKKVSVILYNCCSLHLESEHRPASAASRRRCPSGTRGSLSSLVGQTATSLGAGSVVVVPVTGLHEVHEVTAVKLLEGVVKKTQVADDSRCNEQDHEEDEESEVKDCVADDATLAKLGLLERVDRRADLTTEENVSKRHDKSIAESTYLGRSQKSMTEWNLSM